MDGIFIKVTVFISVMCGRIFSEHDKRLVLHSSEDLLNVISKLERKVESLDAEVTALKAKQLTCGATYIRWGKTACPMNGTELIYKGYMAGDKWDEYGGGSNNLCLPEDPTWNQYVDGYNSGAVIYGTEIEADSAVSNKLFGKPTDNQDIPCAVCRSSRASHLMLPARTNCYPGWTGEYDGYLVSGHPAWKTNSDYICLDSGLEFVPHGSANDNEHVLMPVEVRCGLLGSLPCPPFVDGRELACVFCTK
ncbi:uncharacterized protein LOC132735306 [Ruditapes philippinarum]|uniref:uncharacterized protein LOC132735306 n=1 Tax=Ruditapes philippinarum TaxID=129788 RepID=UPI00295ACCB0|nr:uncharacterized protein LOC132735306 [Ruditapes philippinarum]